jgi:hypothetical protein
MGRPFVIANALRSSAARPRDRDGLLAADGPSQSGCRRRGEQKIVNAMTCRKHSTAITRTRGATQSCKDHTHELLDGGCPSASVFTRSSSREHPHSGIACCLKKWTPFGATRRVLCGLWRLITHRSVRESSSLVQLVRAKQVASSTALLARVMQRALNTVGNARQRMH